MRIGTLLNILGILLYESSALLLSSLQILCYYDHQHYYISTECTI